MAADDGDRIREKPLHHKLKQQEDGDDINIWGILVVGLAGATATTLAVKRLRQTADFIYTQFSRAQASAKSYRSSFQEEAWKKYRRRMQEEYEDEMERVERIKRMQSVFNRERNKQRRGYESWKESGPDNTGSGPYHQQYQRDDWYWKTNASFREQNTNYHGGGAARENRSYAFSHHYSNLGLDRTRTKPYSDAEIKTAFRAKAMEFHPDQNQENKEVAEAKFKEVLKSYEAIKQERKNRT